MERRRIWAAAFILSSLAHLAAFWGLSWLLPWIFTFDSLEWGGGDRLDFIRGGDAAISYLLLIDSPHSVSPQPIPPAQATPPEQSTSSLQPVTPRPTVSVPHPVSAPEPIAPPQPATTPQSLASSQPVTSLQSTQPQGLSPTERVRVDNPGVYPANRPAPFAPRPQVDPAGAAVPSVALATPVEPIEVAPEPNTQPTLSAPDLSPLPTATSPPVPQIESPPMTKPFSTGESSEMDDLTKSVEPVEGNVEDPQIEPTVEFSETLEPETVVPEPNPASDPASELEPIPQPLAELVWEPAPESPSKKSILETVFEPVVMPDISEPVLDDTLEPHPEPFVSTGSSGAIERVEPVRQSDRGSPAGDTIDINPIEHDDASPVVPATIETELEPELQPEQLASPQSLADTSVSIADSDDVVTGPPSTPSDIHTDLPAERASNKLVDTPADAPTDATTDRPLPIALNLAGVRRTLLPVVDISGGPEDSGSPQASGTSGSLGLQLLASPPPPLETPPPKTEDKENRAEPRVVKSVAPVYPLSARWNGVQGSVIVEVDVDADGIPQETVVHRSSGYFELDSAALDAVMNWRFSPALQDGQPIPAKTRVEIVFTLTE